MRRTSRTLKIVLIAAVALAVTAPAIAAPANGPVADVLLGINQVQWVPNQAYAGLKLTVSGPSGIVERSFETGDDVRFELASLAGEVNGTYTWELVAAPVLDAEARSIIAEARALDSAAGDRARPTSLPPRSELIQGGAFRVAGGAVVQPATEAETPAGLRPSGIDQAGSVTGDAQYIAAAAQVFATDLIVQGSACIGQDCTSSESFGFDTIRIKENNTRIKFQDTSNSASFPTTDWELVANDSTNGGRNAFYIRDVDAGREVFTLEANAPSSSLYVDDGGRIGLGTSAPVVQLHVKDGNTPTLRLEQDGSSGFTAQIWDVAGNEANFFVRDASNGSTLPFRIQPGAPSNAIYIAAGGDVGLGTTSPSEELHIVGTDNPRVLIEDTTDNTNDKPGFALRSPAADGGGDWLFEVDNAGNFQIDFGPSSGPEIVLSDTPGSNSTVTINGNLVVNGTCTGCDGVFDESFALLSIEEQAEYMWTNSYLPAVGPTPDGNTPIDVYQKTTGILQELEKAHIYIDQLNKRLGQLEKEASRSESD